MQERNTTCRPGIRQIMLKPRHELALGDIPSPALSKTTLNTHATRDRDLAQHGPCPFEVLDPSAAQRLDEQERATAIVVMVAEHRHRRDEDDGELAKQHVELTHIAAGRQVAGQKEHIRDVIHRRNTGRPHAAVANRAVQIGHGRQSHAPPPAARRSISASIQPASAWSAAGSASTEACSPR